tara:strand:+ start:247 stop:438 length:192 start_codon:yes stop_codon:yes gene_type:complete
MTKEERYVIISNIAQATCDAFDLGEHLRFLYRRTEDELESSGDDYIKEQADFYGVEIETSTPD